MSGCFHSARFAGRRKTRQENVGEYKVFQARTEKARIPVQSQRNAHHPDSRWRCCESVRILEQTFRRRSFRARRWISHGGGRKSAAARDCQRCTQAGSITEGGRDFGAGGEAARNSVIKTVRTGSVKPAWYWRVLLALEENSLQPRP